MNGVLSLPRLRAQTPSESFSGLKRGSCTWGSGTIMQSPPNLAIPSECAIVPRVPPLGGSHHWGRVAPPIAALSGSPPKAPGSAGGYLLSSENVRTNPLQPSQPSEEIERGKLSSGKLPDDLEHRGRQW